MEFNDNVIYNSAEEILRQTPRSVTLEWELHLHTPEGTIFEPLWVDQVDIIGDHMAQFTDALMVTATYGMGTFSTQIYPNKNRMKATLIRRTSQYDQVAATYNVIFLDTASEAITTGEGGLIDVTKADRADLRKVSFQLVDAHTQAYMAKEVKGIPRRTTPENIIRTLMTGEPDMEQLTKPVASKTDYQAGSFEGQVGIEMWPVTNNRVYEQLILPRNLRVTQLPKYLQETEVGIYSAGLGYYLWKGVWFLYPLYDITRFDEAKDTLTVVNVPSTKMPGVESTWHYLSENRLMVLSTAEVDHDDISDIVQVNEGNGVRFTRGVGMIDTFAPVSGNKVYRGNELNVSEFVSEQREVGNNRVRSSERIATDNYCRELSRLAKGQGGEIEFIWENSNHDLIKPGMPVKFLYPHGNSVEALVGTVLGITTSYRRINQDMTETRFTSKSVLKLWVSRVQV